MGFGSRASLAAVLGFAAAFAVACGSSGNGLLSADQSSSIADQLTSVSSAVSAGHCGRAAAASRRLNNQISGLPSDVNQKLVANLGQGAATVSALATKDCQQSTSTTTTSVTSTSSTPTTSSTQAVTTTSTTAPPTSTSTSVSTSTPPPTTATNGGGPGTSSNTTAGGAPVGGGTKTSGG
jgi:hypothetical protein